MSPRSAFPLLALQLLAACGAAPASLPDASAASPDVQAAPDVAATDIAADAWTPASTVDFTGLWVNEEAGTVRAMQFAEFRTDPLRRDLLGLSPVYLLYRYDMGQPPALAQRGRYSMKLGPLLVLTPTFAPDGASVNVPQEFKLVPSAPDTFTVETASGLQRVYFRWNTLP